MNMYLTIGEQFSKNVLLSYIYSINQLLHLFEGGVVDICYRLTLLVVAGF